MMLRQRLSTSTALGIAAAAGLVACALALQDIAHGEADVQNEWWGVRISFVLIALFIASTLRTLGKVRRAARVGNSPKTSLGGRLRRAAKVIHVAMASAALASCAPHARSPRAQAAEPKRAASSIDVSAIDPTCKPCDDFYAFANGVWLAKTKIPPTLSSYGPLVEQAERNRRIVNAVILDSAAAVRAGSAPRGSDSFKIGAFYDACVDATRADLLGLQPLKAVFNRIAATVTPAEFMRVAGELKRSDQIGFIAVGVSPDQRDSNHYLTVVAFLGGLGLPNRDYYLGPDAPLGTPACRSRCAVGTYRRGRLRVQKPCDGSDHAAAARGCLYR